MSSDSPEAGATENILVYRESLLAFSETFILAQGEALTRFRSHYVGMIGVGGLATPADRTHLLGPDAPGLWARARFKLLGRVPDVAGKRLRGLRPALVHAHFGTNATDAMWLADCLDVPLVVTFHGFDATMHGIETIVQPSWWPWRLWRRRLVRRASRLIAVSDFIAGRLLRQGLPEGKIVRHYIGIATEQWACRPLAGRSDTVLFVGRLVEKKGLGPLLHAMVSVQAVHPGVDLVVVGDGPLRGALERMARTLGVQVRFMGAQPKAVVAQWMGTARMLCLPSITAANGDAEGLGMVALESMASGMPVVAFRHGGIPEAVVHEETGLLCPEGDVAGLAQGILRLLEDNDRWQAMSAAGRERVVRHFDLARQSAVLEGIYQEAIATYGRRRTVADLAL